MGWKRFDMKTIDYKTTIFSVSVGRNGRDVHAENPDPPDNTNAWSLVNFHPVQSTDNSKQFFVAVWENLKDKE